MYMTGQAAIKDYWAVFKRAGLFWLYIVVGLGLIGLGRPEWAEKWSRVGFPLAILGVVWVFLGAFQEVQKADRFVHLRLAGISTEDAQTVSGYKILETEKKGV